MQLNIKAFKFHSSSVRFIHPIWLISITFSLLSSCLMAQGASSQSSSSHTATLIENILTGKESSLVKKDVGLLPRQLIGHLILAQHPLTAFISQRLPLNQIIQRSDQFVSTMPFAESYQPLQTDDSDVRTSKIKRQKKFCIALFNPTEDIFVTGYLNGVLLKWDVKTGACVPLTGHTKCIKHLQFNKSGTKLVSISDDTSGRIWDVTNGSCLATLSGHTEPVQDAQYNASEDLIVTASTDKTVRIWDAITGTCKVIKEYPCYTSPAFNRRGDKILSSNEHTVEVWEALTGHITVRIDAGQNRFSSAHLNESEDKILTNRPGSFDVWETASGSKLCRVEISERFTSATFCDDGNKILISPCIPVPIPHGNIEEVRDASQGTLLAYNRHVVTVSPIYGDISGWVLFDGSNQPLDSINPLRKFFKVGLKLEETRESSEEKLQFSIPGKPNLTALIVNSARGEQFKRFRFSSATTLSGLVYSAKMSSKKDTLIIDLGDGSLTFWQIQPFKEIREKLFHRVDQITLQQAIVLVAIYEIVIIRRLIKKRGIGAFTDRSKAVAPEMIVLDLDSEKFKGLKDYYNSLPEVLKPILQIYVRNAPPQASGK